MSCIPTGAGHSAHRATDRGYKLAPWLIADGILHDRRELGSCLSFLKLHQHQIVQKTLLSTQSESHGFYPQMAIGTLVIGKTSQYTSFTCHTATLTKLMVPSNRETNLNKALEQDHHSLGASVVRGVWCPDILTRLTSGLVWSDCETDKTFC